MARTLVGLDIGSTGVRAAEFVPKRRRAVLRRFASVPLEPGVVRAGAVEDPEALTQALRQLWSEGKFTSRTVSLGIANAGVLVRQMDLDWMPPKDFRQALRYQVEDSLPIPVDDANLDYHLLEELDLVEGKESRKVARVLLVAAAREMVDGFVEATHRAGLRTTSVDILPFALIRARAPHGLEADQGTEAIVDVGADTLTVVVHTGGVPRFVRMIPGSGGASITEALRAAYDWTWEDAERTKVSAGLPGHASLAPEQLGAVRPRTDGLDHPAQTVISAAAETVVGEVAATLDYYRVWASEHLTQDEPAPVSQVMLAGSGARLGGLRELFEARLEIPVDTLDVLTQMRAPRRLRLTDDDLCSLAVPAGLCLGGVR